MSKKKIVLIVLGVLLILPLFIAFFKSNMEMGSLSESANMKLFEKDVKEGLEILGVGKAYKFFVITKIAAIIAIICGIAIAVVNVLKIFNINLPGIIDTIATLAIGIAGIVVLVAGFIFFCAGTEKVFGAKIFFSGAIGWYLTWIPAIAASVVSKKLKD